MEGRQNAEKTPGSFQECSSAELNICPNQDVVLEGTVHSFELENLS